MPETLIQTYKGFDIVLRADGFYSARFTGTSNEIMRCQLQADAETAVDNFTTAYAQYLASKVQST